MEKATEIMVKINRGYKSKNSNKTQKAMQKGSTPTSTTSRAPTKAELAVEDGKRKLQEIEEERMSYEMALKKNEAMEEEHEMQNQQDINHLEEMREVYKDSPELYALHSELQMNIAEVQRQRKATQEERAEELKKKRAAWSEREEEIYNIMRRELEDEQSSHKPS